MEATQRLQNSVPIIYSTQLKNMYTLWRVCVLIGGLNKYHKMVALGVQKKFDE